MENQLPKTKQECFAQLDALLNEEDKKVLMEDDGYNCHFSLGLWIRNNWFYSLNKEEKTQFLKMFADDSESEYEIMFCHPDDVSSVIIEKYVEYLKNQEMSK